MNNFHPFVQLRSPARLRRRKIARERRYEISPAREKFMGSTALDFLFAQQRIRDRLKRSE